ncbi:MADS-box transcription factor, partial [Mucor lusitanicus CBS 277.49]
RRKIKIEYIEDKNRRHITFSKRKAGIMKKAYELSTLTGTQVLLLVVSETGLVYTFTTTKLQPIVTKPEGKNLIQACLNTPDPSMPEVSFVFKYAFLYCFSFGMIFFLDYPPDECGK